MPSPARKLSTLLEKLNLITMPCCFDAFSAKVIEQNGFPLTFMSGFAVSAARLGVPDTGLISYGEMVEQGCNITQAVSIPVIGDGDTGYGNALNVKRTVKGYAAAGFACIMIEDQVAPKRCGHTKGKAVVERDEALMRIRAACDARQELRDQGRDILIMARTDARTTDGMDEALARVNGFAELGADITFLEAPESEEEMARYCQQTPGYKMANMVEQGKTPILSPKELEEIGYKIAAYPLTLLLASLKAMETALAQLKNGQHPAELSSFEELKNTVGFPSYYEEEERYK
ncbi:MAG: isocitrate lyase/PEP mutase family protein [Rhodospirillales bacterium]|nr:isocitrate lyase/PEP mutase family protein [Rhodospirillales bacterium]